MACRVNTDGFQAADFKSHLERELDLLLDASPSDSAGWSTISSQPGGFTGEIDIVSCEGRFKARSMKRDLVDLERELMDQMWRQIRGWRKARFEGENYDGFAGERGWFGAA